MNASNNGLILFLPTAEQAKIKDHPLFTGEYSAEVRNAYFSGCAASLCFLDDNLDADEQKNLQFFGQSLRLTSADVEDSIKTVREIGDDDKMEFLQEIFSLMDSDYLKYALLTDIHTLCMKKGSLTDDEKDFINTSAEILFGEEKDMFQLWEKGLTLENADSFFNNTEEVKENIAVEEENIVSDRDPFFIQLAAKNREMWLEVAELLQAHEHNLAFIKEQGFDDNLLQKLFEDYDLFCEAEYQRHSIGGAPLDSPIDVSEIPDEMLQEMVCDGITLEDMHKCKKIADINEILLFKMGMTVKTALEELNRQRLQEQIKDLEKKIEESKYNSRLACFGRIDDSNVYVAPNIPYDKLKNAIEAYAPCLDPDDVLLLFDDTAFGGARDGMLITYDSVYSHEIFMEPVHRFFYKDSDIRYGGKKIFIDGEQACNLCLASESLIKELAEGIATLTALTE